MKTKMNTYVKTGTFLTQAGNTRTMNFVDVVDIPRKFWGVSELEENLNSLISMVNMIALVHDENNPDFKDLSSELPENPMWFNGEK